MPGIFGLIGSGSIDVNVSMLHQMVKRMTYEPSFISGTYVNEELGLFVGWVGHEGSFSDFMPVWNETKDIGIIFSGEDFTDQSEIDYLSVCSQGVHVVLLCRPVVWTVCV